MYLTATKMLGLTLLWAAVRSAGAEENDRRCYDADGERFCLPWMLGVGTVRSGTTSLAQYLNAHPSLTFGVRKEHWWFRFRSEQLARHGELAADAARPAVADVPEGLVAARHSDGGWHLANVTFSSGGILRRRRRKSIPSFLARVCV